jgi:hypothetical protein
MTTTFDLAAAKVEYERLCRWRSAWSRLANDGTRMRRLGGLQRTQERVERRGVLCNYKIANLMREYDMSVQEVKVEQVSECQTLIASALAKLTDAERKALGL